MITRGVRAKLTCVDTQQLPSEFAGREFDETFLSQLRPETDPCAERGEFIPASTPDRCSVLR